MGYGMILLILFIDSINIMGNYCKGQQNIDRQSIQFPNPVAPYVGGSQKCPSQSIRMGDVIRSKSSSAYLHNNYNFNLSIKQSYNPVNVKCSIISSHSDSLALKIPVLGGIDTVRVDARNAPILDYHDLTNNSQILHKFSIKSASNIQSIYNIKLYRFNTFQDNIFKIGLYEAYLYNTLNEYNNSTSCLQDLFIIDKGTPKSLVFVFNSYLYTLEDVLIYRKLAGIPYTPNQQLYLAYQILSKYLVLYRNSIMHRDIRPGKIYLSDSANPLFRGYEFQNLESARRMTERDSILTSKENGNDMLMTVRGVPAYSSDQVFPFHQRGQELGIYDPWYNDRIGLLKTIIAVATLQLDPSHQSLPDLQKSNPTLHQTLQSLHQSDPLQQILRSLSTKIDNKTNTILQSDYNICLNYLPRLIRQSYKQKIQEATTQVLFDLHLREQFMRRLDRIIGDNYRAGLAADNVGVFDRIGRYYQGVGLTQNQYYQEEINVLVELAEDHRKRGFNTDNYLGLANQIHQQKFSLKCPNQVTNTSLKIQNSYSALQKQNLQYSLNQISRAMLEASTSTQIPVKEQIKLIEARGIVETACNGYEAGNLYFENGLMLSSNRQNFVTQVQMLDFMSDFQYLLGRNLVMRIHNSRGSISQQQLSKLCGQCQSILTSAKTTKLQIPLKNPLPLAHIYQSLGDLALIRQDYNGSIELYDRCYRLMVGSEVEIANREKMRILEKMYDYYSKYSENFREQERIKVYLNDLRKSQLKSENDDRKYFKSIRYRKEQMRGRSGAEKPNAIQEVQQAYEEDQSRRAPALMGLQSGNKNDEHEK